jgi:SAM-dependent methyltransferase
VKLRRTNLCSSRNSENELKIKERQRSAFRSEIGRTWRAIVPPGSRVLHIGCGDGRLLASLRPSFGMGFDRNAGTVEQATALNHGVPDLVFISGKLEDETFRDQKTFEYVIINDFVIYEKDLQGLLKVIRPLCHRDTRLILNYPSNLWRPLFAFLKYAGEEKATGPNWLSRHDI